MPVRLLATLAAAAALLGVAAPARADNMQLIAVVIKWSAVVEKDGGALGVAVNKGPSQADAAALQLKRDSIAAANALDAVRPSSSIGSQVRDQLATSLRSFQQSGQELHLAVVAANRNDVKGATAHANKAVALAKSGSALMTQTTKLLAKLRA
jgi:hypothetical protein